MARVSQEAEEVDKVFDRLFDYNEFGDVIYIGRAEPGSATNKPVWQIMKLTYTVNQDVDSIRFANGKYSFEFVWDNRATYAYG